MPTLPSPNAWEECNCIHLLGHQLSFTASVATFYLRTATKKGTDPLDSLGPAMNIYYEAKSRHQFSNYLH